MPRWKFSAKEAVRRCRRVMDSRNRSRPLPNDIDLEQVKKELASLGDSMLTGPASGLLRLIIKAESKAVKFGASIITTDLDEKAIPKEILRKVRLVEVKGCPRK
jgi:hypothetical protein